MTMYSFHANALRPLVARYRGDRKSEVGRFANDLLDALLSTAPIELVGPLRLKSDNSGPALVLERNRDWDACPIRFIPVPETGLCDAGLGIDVECCETTTTTPDPTSTTIPPTTTTVPPSTTLPPTTTTVGPTTTLPPTTTTPDPMACGGTGAYYCDAGGCLPVAPACSGECSAGESCTVHIPTAHGCDPGGAGLSACPELTPCTAECLCLPTTTTTCAPTTTTPAPTWACCICEENNTICMEMTEAECLAAQGSLAFHEGQVCGGELAAPCFESNPC